MSDVNNMPALTMTRREALKLTAAAALLPIGYAEARSQKKVIVAGGGIGGLSCGWELLRRGHDVTVLEASERTGGHVFTYREGLDDGLYADGGAEHFTKPGYDRYWSYVNEFNLAHRYYPRRERILRWYDGKMHKRYVGKSLPESEPGPSAAGTEVALQPARRSSGRQ